MKAEVHILTSCLQRGCGLDMITYPQGAYRREEETKRRPFVRRSVHPSLQGFSMAPGEVSTAELLRAQTRVWNTSFGCVRSLSVMLAVQLGIPDAVSRHGGPISLPDLASAVGVAEAKVPALRRLMRVLSCCGVFDSRVEAGGEEEEGRGSAVQEAYLPTVFSRLLAEDSPTGGAAFLVHVLCPALLKPWYSMAAWFRGDGPGASTGFEAAHGETFLEFYDRDADFNAEVHSLMAGDSRWVAGLIAREHPEVFRGLASLVDVGGGRGAATKAIKDAFPEMRCTVLEKRDTVVAAPAVEGVDFVEGDMFEHIPPSDGILLKWVLVNWDDDDCVRILQRCREAILERGLGGKVIIIEIVLRVGRSGDHELAEAQHLFDLFMLPCFDRGRERDEAEWRRIFAAAGFADYKITPALGPRSIIEVFP